MKALNRITGRIIDVIYDERCFQYIDKDGNNYVSSELDFNFEDTIDWEQRRFELAKAAMQGVLSNSLICKRLEDACEKTHCKFEDVHATLIAEFALDYADAVIAKLKEK